jgi:hypothetical protein
MPNLIHWKQKTQRSFHQHAWVDETVYAVPFSVDPDLSDAMAAARIRAALYASRWLGRDDTVDTITRLTPTTGEIIIRNLWMIWP